MVKTGVVVGWLISSAAKRPEQAALSPVQAPIFNWATPASPLLLLGLLLGLLRLEQFLVLLLGLEEGVLEEVGVYTKRNKR